MSMSPVRQPLHILRKDAIHLWPETLVSIALLIALAWAVTQSWLPAEGFNEAQLSAGFIKFLLPLAWLVLISRLVHDEELVGDRQFWTTRPYTWYSLLAAKLLYIVFFIAVPLLIMQAWVLHHAGLYPTHLIPALLMNLLYVAAIFLLPLLVVAAVTGTFPRYISSVLGGIIYLFVIVAIVAHNWLPKLSSPYLTEFILIVLLLMLLVALFVQYALRKTLIARVILLAAPIVVVLLTVAAPANLLNEHRFPDVSHGTLTFDTNPMRQQPTGTPFVFASKVFVDIPIKVQLNGLPSEAFLDVQHLRATLDGPNGFHYDTGWLPDSVSLYSDRESYVIPVVIPQNIYDKIHDQTVAIHLQLGTQTFQPGTPYSITATETAFPIPNHASCTLPADGGALECRFPFANKQVTNLSASVHNGDCLNPGPQSAIAFGSIPPSPFSFGFDPVEIVPVPFGIGQQKIPGCPGTRITFTPTIPAGYGRLHLDIPTITLESYVRHIPIRHTQQQAPQPAP